jgi:hypothetical protein
VPEPDDPLNAVRAAVEMRERLRKINEDFVERGLPEINESKGALPPSPPPSLSSLPSTAGLPTIGGATQHPPSHSKTIQDQPVPDHQYSDRNRRNLCAEPAGPSGEWPAAGPVGTKTHRKTGRGWGPTPGGWDKGAESHRLPVHPVPSPNADPGSSGAPTRERPQSVRKSAFEENCVETQRPLNHCREFSVLRPVPNPLSSRWRNVVIDCLSAEFPLGGSSRSRVSPRRPCRNNEAFEKWGVHPLSFLFQCAFSNVGPVGPHTRRI